MHACMQIITPLLLVLEKMHGLHLLHRDIKPENIFLSASACGALRLGDFGLAVDDTRELPFSRSGTLDYMAPEVRTRACVCVLGVARCGHRRRTPRCWP